MYLSVRRGRGTEGVSLNNELFGCFNEVRYHVRDVTLRDVVLCGSVKYLGEHGLTRATGGR